MLYYSLMLAARSTVPGRSVRLRVPTVVVTLAVIASGCGDSGGPKATTPTASSTVPEASANSGHALPVEPGPLPAGRYQTSRFLPRLSVSLGPGWTLLPVSRTSLRLVRRDGTLVGLFRFTRVIDPSSHPATDPVSADVLQPLPANFARWLAEHPRLSTSGPRPVRVDGLPAGEVDATVRDGYRSAGCPGRCVVIVSDSDGSASQSEGQKSRAVVLDGFNPPLAIVVISPTDAFRVEARRFQQILNSIRVDA